MMSTWIGRLIAAAILALSCISSTAMANVRVAADTSLAELSAGGAASCYRSEGLRYGWLLRAQAARLELGAEVTDNIGVTAGAALAESWWLIEISVLPISARVYWDFTPNELWIRRTAYITATYHHDNIVFDEPTPPPFFSLGVGTTFTWYAVTARAELVQVAFPYPVFGLLLGVNVGGSYILGRHHE